MNATEKRNKLRAVLAGPRLVSPATVFDALSARVAESVGYEFGILSGSVCAATVLAAPDLALQTLTEFADQVRRIEGIINSMTGRERAHPDIIKASRKRRIATGAGVSVQEVNRLLNQFEQMQKMMKMMKGGNLARMMRNVKGMLPGMR